MTDSNLTHLALVLDRSGSMNEGGKAQEAVKGVRSLLAEQKALPGKLEVTIVQFDDRYDTIVFSLPADDVHDNVIQIEPRGMTALYDAVGRLVVGLGTDLAERPESARPGRVVVLVATDGLENASKEYTAATLRKLIEEQTNNYGWEFMFMGTSQEAMLQAMQAGFAANLSYASTDSAAGVSSSYGVASASLTSSRLAGTRTQVTDEDRKKLR